MTGNLPVIRLRGTAVLACAGLAVAAGVLSGADPGSGSASAGEPLRLGLPSAVNTGVSLAASGTSVVVAWAARSDAATDVYTAWSRDGGASFEAPLRVNDMPGDARVSGEQAPRVALGGATRVVWISSQAGVSVVRSATRSAGAPGFGPAATIHPEGLTGARGWFSLAAGQDGAAHVAWLDGRGDGAAVDAPAKVAAPAAHHGGHEGRQDLFHVSISADGARAETRIATNVCFCCKTAVASGPDGALYVAWRHIYPPNLRDIAIARSADGGRTFAAPVRVSEDGWAIDGCPDDGPAIGVDAKGALHVVWPTRVSDSGKGVFYTRSTDGGRSFAPRVRVDQTAGGAAHPQLAVAGDRVVVAWDETTAAGRRVVLREVAAASEAWPPRLGETAVLSAGPASYPAVAATETATVAAWTEGDRNASVVRVTRIAR
jgi:hypothetical protein